MPRRARPTSAWAAAGARRMVAGLARLAATGRCADGLEGRPASRRLAAAHRARVARRAGTRPPVHGRAVEPATVAGRPGRAAPRGPSAPAPRLGGAMRSRGRSALSWIEPARVAGGRTRPRAPRPVEPVTSAIWLTEPNWVGVASLPLRIGRASGSAKETSRLLIGSPRTRSPIWSTTVAATISRGK